MLGLNTTLVIAVALVTYNAVTETSEFPLPRRYVWIAVVWSILGLIAPFAPQLAVVFAVGLLIAMGYRYFLGGTLLTDKETAGQGQSGSREGPSSLPQPRNS